MRRLLILAAVLALASQTASAATLDRIRDIGVFRIGYRADAKPYSYQDEQGQPAGYIVDLCVEIARGARSQRPAAICAACPPTSASSRSATARSTSCAIQAR